MPSNCLVFSLLSTHALVTRMTSLNTSASMRCTARSCKLALHLENAHEQSCASHNDQHTLCNSSMHAHTLTCHSMHTI